MKRIVIIYIFMSMFNIIYSQTNNSQPAQALNPCTLTDIAVKDTTIHVPLVIPPVVFTDSDGDGIPDDIEGNEDCDNDGVPNYLDLDSDNDGKSDSFEGDNDMDGDGLRNFCDTDSDGDGVDDNTDACYFEFGVPPHGCSVTFDYRNVFWVHGYQGNENSWMNAADDVGGFDIINGIQNPTGRFKVLSHKTDYNISQASLQTSADNLESDIAGAIANQVNTSRNFIIAHSLGGLVTRKMGALSNPAGGKAYNGLITFGTPHRGAAAANTLVEHPERINNALTHACNELAAGPVDEGVNNTGVLGSLGVLFGFAGGVLNTVCDAGVSVGFPLLASFASTGTEAEVVTDGPLIPNMPTENNALFFGTETSTNAAGVEDGSLTPRFIGAALANPNSFPLYTADASDGVGLATVAAAITFYISKATTFQNIHNILCQGSPLCWTSAGRIAKSYRKGLNWFPTLDPTWKFLIGAGPYHVNQIGCECSHYNNGTLIYTQFYPGLTNCPANQNNGQYTVVCVPKYEVINEIKASDGFILAESAMDGPGMNYKPQLMLGSNHLQMRNDSNMGSAVTSIFRDGIDGRNYFKTDPR